MWRAEARVKVPTTCRGLQIRFNGNRVIVQHSSGNIRGHKVVEATQTGGRTEDDVRKTSKSADAGLQGAISSSGIQIAVLPFEIQASILTLASPVSSNKADILQWMMISRLFQEALRPLLYCEVRIDDSSDLYLLVQSFAARSCNGALVRSVYFARDVEDMEEQSVEQVENLLRSMTGLLWFRTWFNPFSATALKFWSNRASLFPSSLEVIRLSNSDVTTFWDYKYLNRRGRFFWEDGEAWQDVKKFSHIKAFSIITFIPMVDKGSELERIFCNLAGGSVDETFLRVLHIRHGVEESGPPFLSTHDVYSTARYDTEHMWRRDLTGIWEGKRQGRTTGLSFSPSTLTSIFTLHKVCDWECEVSNFRRGIAGPAFGGHLICGKDMDPFLDDVREVMRESFTVD